MPETDALTSSVRSVNEVGMKTEAGRIHLAGVLLFIGGVWNLLSTLAAESLQPSYDTSLGSGSGLGVPYFSSSPPTCSTLPQCGIPVQPSSAVFVSSLFLVGASFLWAGVLLRAKYRLFGLGVAVSGGLVLLIGFTYAPFYLGTPDSGVVGVTANLHIASTLLVFALLVTLMISSYRVSRGPFRFLSLALGVVALASLLLALSGNYLGLGPGGLERFTVSSYDIWAAGLGTHLLTRVE